MPAGLKAGRVLPSKPTSRAFPAARRLVRRTEFERAFRASKLNNAWFTAYVYKKKEGPPRLGVAVSKKIAPKAVTRNYIKRVIREAFRNYVPAWTALDIVVLPRNPLSSGCSAEGLLALKQLFLTLQK